MATLYSKKRWRLGLRPRPRWGSLLRSPRPPNRGQLRAFGARSASQVNFIFVDPPQLKTHRRPCVHIKRPAPVRHGIIVIVTEHLYIAVRNEQRSRPASENRKVLRRLRNWKGQRASNSTPRDWGRELE